MYRIVFSNSFKKDLKRLEKRKIDRSLLNRALTLFVESGNVPDVYKPHKLSGTYAGFWECHIKPDWLLIYEIDEVEKLVILTRTGTHTDLFK